MSIYEQFKKTQGIGTPLTPTTTPTGGLYTRFLAERAGTPTTTPATATPETEQPKGFFGSLGKKLKSGVSDIGFNRFFLPSLGETSVKFAKFIPETFAPALTNFAKTTGGILGEGLAYALDPNVRKQYRAGKTDILPTVTATSLGGLTKDTLAAGLETAVFKYIPKTAKLPGMARFGVGSLQGLGFAISEGLAKDYTPEQIVKNAGVYGVIGGALEAITPVLLPLLKTELSKVPLTVKQEIKKMWESASKTTPEIRRAGFAKIGPEIPPEAKTTQPLSAPEAIPKGISKEEWIKDSRKILESGGVSPEKTTSIIQKLKGVINKSSPDIEKDIRFIADTSNPSTRKAFEAATGVKLGNTQKGAQQQIRDFIGKEAPQKKWLTTGEAKKGIQDNIGKEVVIDDNKRDWIGGREPRTSNPSLVKLIGIEDSRVIYTRGGYEYSKHIDTVRDIIVDGKSQIGDIGNEKYASSLFPKVVKTPSQLSSLYDEVAKQAKAVAPTPPAGAIPEVKPISEISATPKSITAGTPEVPPQLSPTAPLVSEELSSINKVTQALKESKPLRGKQEALYSAERSQRMAKALAVGEKTTGEAGFYRELGQLKGELPKVQFEEIRSKIGQADIDNLFGQIKNSQLLNFWDSVTARGGLLKVLEGRVPTEGELTLLGRVFPKEFIEAVLGKRSLFERFKEAGYQLANLPRSIMASVDLSAPFRQGLFLIGHPKKFFSSFVGMFKAFGSEKAFKAIQESIIRKPTFELMKDSKLALTEMDAILTAREERFMSSWAEKIPIVGKVIRASGRAYTGFLNKLRADVFEDLVMKADKLGLTPRSNPQLTKEIANFVNAASGRGSLGSLQPAAKALNSFFFSPRLMASRLTLLNPVYYIKADPFVRREALKSLFSILGVGTTILGLSKLAGVDVGIDPRSADFGKIIIGKTRIDVWGGFQQYVRMFAQLATGQYVSSVTGKLVTLGEGYKPLTRFEILQRQIEAKEAPIFSLITTLLKGRNFLGEKIKITDEIKNRLTPMAISDIYDIYKNDPESLPISAAGLFGFGLQTYSGEIPTEKEKKQTYEISKLLGQQALEREGLSNAARLLDKELLALPKEEANTRYQQIKKENPELANKLKDVVEERKLGLTYTEKLMKQLGVENGERAKYINEQIMKLPTREERRDYYNELKKKGIISTKISNQIQKLVKSTK